ncbi:gas vesicle protein GvpG [Dactylosporangium sp. NBC_01737]|uniref:gas vesicle protein GvpG n=1 Tax=Dactylosporangium sp. NBC_01737 TaxID=2975959 RepID=UPI002E124C98|nr:gas vesicle protein GvpG [Dactylosporangium sp. NBC_01737]
MGLLSGILTLPLAPVRVVFWLGDVIREQAEHQLYDPGVIRRRLEDLQDARVAGRISEQDADREEQELLDRLFRSPSGGG